MYSLKQMHVNSIAPPNLRSKRSMAEKMAAGVPNVKQVVNEIEVNNQSFFFVFFPLVRWAAMTWVVASCLCFLSLSI